MTESVWMSRGFGRIQSIDRLRGIVIVLMVVDHVRDFIHASGYAFDPLDFHQTTVLIYLTRWVTHFCAPTFVFLAGVSSWLQLARGKEKGALAWLLLTRGLWLVLLENTVIELGWSFAIPSLIFVQVIWAIGWGMVALAGLIWLPRTGVLAIGIAITVGHNLLDGIRPEQLGAFATLWKFLYIPDIIHVGSLEVLSVYPLLPWLGVMCLGYGIGAVFVLDPPRRHRALVQIGLCLIATFFVMRFFNLYGDPRIWQPQSSARDTLMVFFNVTKYPPSLLYVCATLGPALICVPLIERWRGPAARFFETFGAVPFLAYVLHLYIAHALSIAVTVLMGASIAALIDPIGRSNLHPELMQGTGLPLYMVYLVWLAVLAILYPLCRWFAGVRKHHRHWWLSYL